MTPRTLAIALLLAASAFAAQPLPELRTEATNGGSIFYVKNTGSQPLTAFVIELVNYPGSSYTLWEDEGGSTLIAPGAEKRIPVTNMTVGAVPDYVKLTAALFADGSSAGVPERATQIVDRRRVVKDTTREVIARLQKAQADSKPKAEVAADLKQWADSLQPARRVNRMSSEAIHQAAARGVVEQAAKLLESHSVEETLAKLR